MIVPAEYKSQYDVVRRASGKAYADQWLSNKLQHRGKSTQSRGRGARAKSQASQEKSGLVPAVPTCAADYAKLLISPFDDSLAPCLPLAPAVDSLKVSTKIRAIMTTGTSKFGFVTVNPRRMIANDMAAGSRPVQFSLNTYAGTTTESVPTTGVWDQNSDSPFAAADFGDEANNLQYRLVHAAIRAKYIGKAVDRGGVAYAFADPNEQDVAGLGTGDFMSMDGVQAAVPSADGWLSLGFIMGSVDRGKYTSNLVYEPCMAVVWTSPDAGQQLEFEVRAVFEVIGPIARGKTASFTAVAATNAALHAKAAETGWTTNGVAGSIKSALTAAADVTTTAMRTAAVVGQGWTMVKNLGRYLMPAAEAAPLLLTL